MGRIDDVLNVAGHRIGTAEVESALVDHPAVAEAAVVGKTHEIKGQAIAAFVTLRAGFTQSGSLRDELREHVAMKIGALARPDDILFSADLPKTRSGKIMRRLLRDIAEAALFLASDSSSFVTGSVMLVDVSSYGCWVRFSGGGSDLLLRREECVLHGRGEIALGSSFADLSAPTVSFSVS